MYTAILMIICDGTLRTPDVSVATDFEEDLFLHVAVDWQDDHDDEASADEGARDADDGEHEVGGLKENHWDLEDTS